MFPFDLDLFLLGHLERWSGLVLEACKRCISSTNWRKFIKLMSLRWPWPCNSRLLVSIWFTKVLYCNAPFPDQVYCLHEVQPKKEEDFSYHKAVWIAVGLQWTLYWYTFLTIGGLSGNVSYQCFSQSLTTIAYRYGLDKINRSKWYLRKCVPYIPV